MRRSNPPSDSTDRSTASGTNGAGRAKRPGKCPICAKPVDPAAKTLPFCSSRCRTIDLGKWLNEEYTISRPIEQSDLDEA